MADISGRKTEGDFSQNHWIRIRKKSIYRLFLDALHKNCEEKWISC